MPDAVVQIDGLREFRRTMKQAGADMAEFAEAGKRTADLVASYAIGAAPRRSGALASSIRSSRARTRVTIMAGNNSDVPYAGPIHWGWPTHNIRSNPFMTNAASMTEPIWTAYYLAELNRILSRVHGA